MEKQPAQATNAPFRRRRPSRRRGGRRNDSERAPGSFNSSGGDGTRPAGSDMLEQDPSGRVVATDENGENRMSDEEQNRSQSGSQNGDQAPRGHESGEGSTGSSRHC